jgi:hypothetical protein
MKSGSLVMASIEFSWDFVLFFSGHIPKVGDAHKKVDSAIPGLGSMFCHVLTLKIQKAYQWSGFNDFSSIFYIPGFL